MTLMKIICLDYIEIKNDFKGVILSSIPSQNSHFFADNIALINY